MHCEVCGREIVQGYLVEIEGAQLVACADCAERGVIVRKVIDRSEPSQSVVEDTPRSEERDVVLVADYGQRIRKARERAGVSLEELAKKLRIPAGYLRRVEDGELTPTDDLAHRLEKVLKISLFEEVEEDDDGVPTTEDDVSTGLTLGDVVRLSWRKKE